MFTMDFTHTFTKREEIANSITHGIGVLLSIAALVLLIVFASINGNAWHVVSFTLFGSTMVLLCIASSLVQSFAPGTATDVFEIFDQSAIYRFTAGTYPPFLFIAVNAALGWTRCGIVWGRAIFGAVFKVLFVNRFLQ